MRCEYCRGKFIPDSRGCCNACNAPAVGEKVVPDARMSQVAEELYGDARMAQVLIDASQCGSSYATIGALMRHCDTLMPKPVTRTDEISQTVRKKYAEAYRKAALSRGYDEQT